MTTTARRVRIAVASAACGLLVGFGAASAVVDDTTAVPVTSLGEPPPVEDVAHAEALRAAVQRCVLGPLTPDAPAQCEAGLRHA